MEKIAVLVLVLGCCFCVADNSGFASSGDVYSLTTIALNVGALGEKVANMADKITFLETKLQNADREILKLRSLVGGTPQVAFSAALRDSGAGDIGPFTTATPLKYKKIFSNYGDCYNPFTGIFTATVSGVYFFRFSMFNNLSPTPNSVVSLKKNDERLTSVWDTKGTDSNDMGSNAVVIPLKAGDTVYVELQENRLVYDDLMYYNTFSGFLLFTM
ncbi:complement C1q-like protein 3 [Oryzias melastigma]|uniref:complement C1q-like protein 3 n=1 Tax=Oryzias melastigma TaxID=30732 RepID=UPI000CF824AE|nr:complement C1q-like protein 3 [Oryzias melastigma]